MDLGLTDRVYIVTGAARGLGRACAEQLAGEGARLVLTGADEAALRGVASGMGGPERAIALGGDLSDPGLETCLVAAAVARYGRLDGALITVEAPPAGTVMDTDDGAWRLGFEASFLGPLRLCRTVGRYVSAEGGSLVLVLSTAAREPVEGLALSNGLRPGLAMVAKTLADELGPRNIRVNGVLPGRIDTARRRPEPPGPDEGDRHVLESAIPLRRFGEPAEFARPAVFLLSPSASYVSGTLLQVDGGMTRRL
ncbi:MAG: SDR family oxidoreductase [Kineosporiaceae bacterium]|jgi:3-oxoacyl-[acyl-carrier protein] reductase